MSLSSRCLSPNNHVRLGLVVLLLASGMRANALGTVFSASGAAGDITPTLDSFRTALGGVNNGVGPGVIATGRREINWDAVPATASAPNALPGGFFNGTAAPRARGAIFSTPGTGVAVSANAGDAAVNFGDINAAYGTQFQPFSAQKLFTAVGSNIVDVTFAVPGDPTNTALSSGFGAVFSDVDLPDSTSISYFDANGALLLAQNVIPGTAPDGSFSFLGASFGSPVVSRVRIVSGNAALGGLEGNGVDLVVMDDFIYGEPQSVAGAIPEPSTLTLLGAGMLAASMRRRKARRR